MIRTVAIRAVLGCALACLLAAGARAGEPRREDRGDLIVLHLQGSYEEMGRQQVELMGPELRAVYELQRADFARGVARGGPGLALLDRLGVPLLSLVGGRFEDSGFYAELEGVAAGLGVPRRDVLRALFSLAGGSTVFAATRSATADGGALLGRNVDWPDGRGRRRPVVMLVHPTNGDLAYVSCGWPLVGLPTVGLNEAGLAFSLNYFVTDPQVKYGPARWPHRRALQTARSVEEAIRVYLDAGSIGISGFAALADATGDIALVECTPEECAVFRPEGDWFGQANHARTEPMIPHDRYRSPDSFARRAAMEAAVGRHLGSLIPELAAAILRDRANSGFANADTLGNLEVLNAAVVQPAAGILWHSTTMQPHAPFGEYVPFSVSVDVSGVRPLPADPRFAAGAMQAEINAVAELRRGLRLDEEHDAAAAAEVFDSLAASAAGGLDPSRLAWARARARWQAGRLEEAYAVLGEVEQAGDAPFEVRAWALWMRAVLADRLGRREEALRLYGAAAAHLESRPEFASYFEQLRNAIAAGAGNPGPQTDAPLPETPHLTRAPR